MVFDIRTLMAVGGLVAAMSAIFVFFAWTHARDGQKLLWWAAGDALYALGTVLLTIGTMPGRGVLILVGATIYAAGPALFWVSARLFGGQRIPFALLGIALVAPVFGAVPPLGSQPGIGMAYNLAIVAILMLATAFAFWRGLCNGYKACRSMIFLCLLQGAIFVAGSVEAASGTIASTPLAPATSLFGLVHYTSILFLLGTAVFVVALAREQSEAYQRKLAETDALTGVATRGAFMHDAQSALDASRRSELPLSMILFDLDRFKSINDRFGHAMGDSVLREFGETVKLALRQADRVGRIGGEEFAVFLPETGLGEAFLIADRIRLAFEECCASVDSQPVHATVSAGVATARPDSTLDSLLATADQGLYVAKDAGRNRVGRARPSPGASALEQVA
ncbi:MAG: GGDEF domain-containing protein [Bauldia sp.]|nr:GGDEF domain-containing protein [Bauldia sp.]